MTAESDSTSTNSMTQTLTTAWQYEDAAVSAQAQRYTAERDAQIPAEYRLPASAYPLPMNVKDVPAKSGILSPKELKITNLDATAIATAIAERKFTAVEVTTAFLKAAAIAQQTVNCLTRFFPEEALERAQWLDEQLEKTGKPVGPLHGVPISVKDMIFVKGIPQACSFLSRAASPDIGEDALIVASLRAAGAVFFVKTTQPQSIMHLETNCYLGKTTNPYNRALTSGGSSGGEGALLGARGSPLGIGTDIGGSIRNPAANNGLWGVKPSCLRLPKRGIQVAQPGYELIRGAVGPMGHSLRDMELFIETVIGSQPARVDPAAVDMPWRPVSEKGVGAGFDGWSGSDGKLKIGVLKEDGIVRPLAPIRRAMSEIIAKLEASGQVELVEIDPRGYDRSWDLISSMYYPDGAKLLKKALVNEPMLPLTEWIVNQAEEVSASELYALTVKREAFRAELFNHFLTLGIDVILSPIGPGPAPLCGTSKYWNYTAFYNLLDWPAASFPTGLQVSKIDEEDSAYSPRNPHEAEVYKHYNPKTFIDAPLCLQLAAPTWQDERLMAALKIVNKVL